MFTNQDFGLKDITTIAILDFHYIADFDFLYGRFKSTTGFFLGN